MEEQPKYEKTIKWMIGGLYQFRDGEVGVCIKVEKNKVMLQVIKASEDEKYYIEVGRDGRCFNAEFPYGCDIIGEYVEYEVAYIAEKPKSETLEDFLRNKVDKLEYNHIYQISTDAIRAWIDEFKRED